MGSEAIRMVGDAGELALQLENDERFRAVLRGECEEREGSARGGGAAEEARDQIREFGGWSLEGRTHLSPAPGVEGVVGAPGVGVGPGAVAGGRHIFMARSRSWALQGSGP